ncbi:MAG TPA: TRAM domain-containing protein, partial [Geminicoccaceae bacterium]|nr:TRAM domain-containing protein [Geminicoccaceae bacterium]
AFNAGCIGLTLPALLERPGRHPGQLVGRTPYLQAIHVRGPGLAVGDLVRVTVTDRHPHSLSGVVAPEASTQQKEACA